jgi:subtilase family serine protease
MKVRLSLAAAVLGISASTISPTTPAHALEKAKIQARASASQPVQFNVYMPVQHGDELDQLIIDLHNPASPQYREWLTPAQFNERFAPDQALINTITKELHAKGLEVTDVHPHYLRVQGNVGAVERAFSTQIAQAAFANGRTTLAATMPMTLTPALASMGAVVAGFSSTIHMHSHSRVVSALPENRYSPHGPYWFTDLKQAYDFPSYQVYTGKGVKIGILMSGGFNPPDMTKYFSHEKLATPSISEVKIFGGAPFDPNSSGSTEAHLDIQQSGGMAPKAQIILFNLPDLSDAAILAGLTTIIETNAVDVVNMSFGGPELFYTPEYNGGVDERGILAVYDALFKQGNAQGITFVASSGDQGALPAPPPACFDPNADPTCGAFRASVEVPAASPHVTGVGGTNLVTTFNATSPNLDSAYIKENAFGDPLMADIFYGTPATGGFWGSGGGKSIYFKKPVYQRLVSTGSDFRTVPDLALHMGGCPFGAVSPCGPDRSSVVVAIGGQFFLVIGTSASAPDFAGLTALKIERLGTRLGNENFDIYALAAAENEGSGPRVFRDDINGFNGKYHTKDGYNLVIGNGTLRGKNFILAPNVPSAGIPQTPSNP